MPLNECKKTPTHCNAHQVGMEKGVKAKFHRARTQHVLCVSEHIVAVLVSVSNPTGPWSVSEASQKQLVARLRQEYASVLILDGRREQPASIYSEQLELTAQSQTEMA